MVFSIIEELSFPARRAKWWWKATVPFRCPDKFYRQGFVFQVLDGINDVFDIKGLGKIETQHFERPAEHRSERLALHHFRRFESAHRGFDQVPRKVVGIDGDIEIDVDDALINETSDEKSNPWKRLKTLPKQATADRSGPVDVPDEALQAQSPFMNNEPV